jgi:hypothetical protein
MDVGYFESGSKPVHKKISPGGHHLDIHSIVVIERMVD